MPRLTRLVVAALPVAVCGVVYAAPAAHAVVSTFVVNTTADHDDGSCSVADCTLREALKAANSAGGGVIHFSIGTGAQTIAPTGTLPFVTAPSVVIDGTTQPGYDGTHPLINVDGTSAGAGSIGLALTAAGDVLKGMAVGDFDGSGVYLGGASGQLLNSYIGLDALGTFVRHNRTGVTVVSDSNVVAGNVIAGNAFALSIISPANGNIVKSNLIGTNPAGTAAVPNLQGLYDQGTNTAIGVGGANVLSGNTNQQMLLFGSGTSVVGNFIGTTADGTAALPNGSEGLHVDATNAVISGNVISGQTVGVTVATEATGNTIEGNHIGTNAAGDGVIANDTGILDYGHDNVIGVPGDGNVISGNAHDGISVQSPAYDEKIVANSIYDNGALGIDLGDPGVTPNDALDRDSGANELQNFPVLTQVGSQDNLTQVSGSLNSEPDTTYTLAFYSNDSCDPTGYGEGQAYAGTGQVTTDSSGHADFTAYVNATTSAPTQWTATATDPDGNTSEFGPCTDVTEPNVDLRLTQTASPTHITVGQQSTITLKVFNAGPFAAHGVSLIDRVPAGLQVVSIQTPQGSCTTDQTVVCDLGTVGLDQTVTVKITIYATKIGSYRNHASVTGDEPDPLPTNNNAQAAIGVTPDPAGCTIVGTDGDDTLTGTSRDDVICGLGGNDSINGLAGNDVIYGGDGNDTITGAGGNDVIYGGDGNDTITGAGGNDQLYGEDGADTLNAKDGVQGNDYVDGGVDAFTDSCSANPGDTVVNCP